MEPEPKTKTDKRLRRIFEIENVRAGESDGKKIISGYASVFDQEAVIMGYFREKFAKGAFKKTLKEYDQLALWNHDDSKPLARRSSKTLTLREDDHGLYFEFEPTDASWGEDAYKAIARGDVKGVSIGFSVVKELYIAPTEENSLPLFEVREAKLYEISPVTFPAYPMTEVEARSAAEAHGFDIEAKTKDASTEKPDESRNHSSTEEPGTAPHSAAGTVTRAMLLLKQQLIEAE